MRARPYPTKEAWRKYAARFALAKQEGRICPTCKMNITDAAGLVCVACKPVAQTNQGTQR